VTSGNGEQKKKMMVNN